MKNLILFIFLIGLTFTSSGQTRPTLEVIPGYPAYRIGDIVNCALLNDTPCMILFKETEAYQIERDEILVELNDELQTKFIAKQEYEIEVDNELQHADYKFDIVRDLE